MMTREQRLREREVKRILHEEQLAKEEEMLKALGEDGLGEMSNGARISHRQLKADFERRQKELEELQELQVEEEWIFDCSVCGVHGKNLDDGSHSIACEKCNVWQHSNCHGIDQATAEREDFHFECKFCKKKEEDEKKRKEDEEKKKKKKKEEEARVSPAQIKAPIFVPYPGPPQGPPMATYNHPSSQPRPYAPPAANAGYSNGHAQPPFHHYQPPQAVKAPQHTPLAAPTPPPQPSNGHSHQVQRPLHQQTPTAAYATPKQPQRDVFARSPNGFAGSFNSMTSTPPPPTPHLPSPHINGGLPAPYAGLQGSSPGYSPTKPPSPPRPAQQFPDRSQVISPPIMLQPQQQQPSVTSPPVKAHNPIHSSPIETVRPKAAQWNGNGFPDLKPAGQS
jgi:hypothetical protein